MNEKQLIWDESKRTANLIKHGLDFADAADVLESTIRMDLIMVRKGESRTQSFAYVMDRLNVLTVVHLDRDGSTRIISYRPASQAETEIYYEWISSEFNDP